MYRNKNKQYNGPNEKNKKMPERKESQAHLLYIYISNLSNSHFELFQCSTYNVSIFSMNAVVNELIFPYFQCNM